MGRNFVQPSGRGSVQGKTKQELEPSEVAMAEAAELAADQHVRYIVTVEKVTHPSTLPLSAPISSTSPRFQRLLFSAQKKDSFESLVMEHIRLNGAYWGLTTLDLLHKLQAVDASEVVDWIMSCYHPESGNPRSIFLPPVI